MTARRLSAVPAHHPDREKNMRLKRGKHTLRLMFFCLLSRADDIRTCGRYDVFPHDRGAPSSAPSGRLPPGEGDHVRRQKAFPLGEGFLVSSRAKPRRIRGCAGERTERCGTASPAADASFSPPSRAESIRISARQAVFASRPRHRPKSFGPQAS